MTLKESDYGWWQRFGTDTYHLMRNPNPMPDGSGRKRGMCGRLDVPKGRRRVNVPSHQKCSSCVYNLHAWARREGIIR